MILQENSAAPLRDGRGQLRTRPRYTPALRIVAGLLLALGASACSRHDQPVPQADPTSLRVTRSGAVVGFTGEYDSHAWLGIPYAQPPVGALRWRAPQALGVWPGTVEALRFGSPCVQYASSFGGVTSAKPGTPVGSEDCLYLNVWAPKMTAQQAAAEKRLPVMLWIHGGGNTIGEGGFYNGGNLATTQKVVVLSFNYRLGPFGWFRHAALRAPGINEDDRSGNYGTLDLVRALEWVRDNISSFGGDPDNVTIFGESAGGQNVYQLLLSPKAKGLFHRGIVESGAMGFNTVAEAENFTDDGEAGEEGSSNETLLRLLIADGRASDRAGAKSVLVTMNSGEIERYLRGKSGFDFLAAYPGFQGTGMYRMPRLFREGTVLPTDLPMNLLSNGSYNQVPVIAGTNRDENKVFMFGDPRRVRKLLWLIPRVRDQRTYDLSAEYLSKSWKATGADEPLAAMRQVQGPTVFGYRFDWDEEPTIMGADLSKLLGAAHGFEIPFVFGHFNLGKEGNQIFTKENEAARLALSAQMMSYWAHFAYTGTPDRGRNASLPAWTAWDSSTPSASKFMVFDTPADGGLRMSSESISQAKLITAVEGDLRLDGPLAKCRIYRELAEWGRGITKAGYASMPGCSSFPYDKYPWDE